MTKQLDRRFRHVGRIKRSWGTTHKPTIRRMESMMDGLFETGRLDILRSLQDGTYTPLQVYDAWRTNDLERLPTAATLAPLKESMEKWIAKKECSEAHRLSLSQSLRHLTSGTASTSHTVAGLPTVLSALRDRFQGKHPRSFNLARAAAQAFAKTTAGRNSKLWQDITAIEVLKVTQQRSKKPLTPNELETLMWKLRWPMNDIAAGMAFTGMGPSEYWGNWEPVRHGYAVHGTKREGRDRLVPYFSMIQRPQVQYAAFRRALRDASDGQVKPYDLRRTFANALEAAGIPRTRRKMYLGHGAKDVTDLYERHEVERFLVEDGERLAKYFFGATGPTLKLEKKA